VSGHLVETGVGERERENADQQGQNQREYKWLGDPATEVMRKETADGNAYARGSSLNDGVAVACIARLPLQRLSRFPANIVADFQQLLVAQVTVPRHAVCKTAAVSHHVGECFR
jgi:hypothetical protein